MKKYRDQLDLAVMLLTLAAEVLPGSICMRFFAGPDAFYPSCCAYWSLLPVGYANIFPMMVLLCSIALLLLFPFYRKARRGTLAVLRLVLVLAALALNILPLLWGMQAVTAGVCAVETLLAVKLALTAADLRARQKA